MRHVRHGDDAGVDVIGIAEIVEIMLGDYLTAERDPAVPGGGGGPLHQSLPALDHLARCGAIAHHFGQREFEPVTGAQGVGPEDDMLLRGVRALAVIVGGAADPARARRIGPGGAAVAVDAAPALVRIDRIHYHFAAAGIARAHLVGPGLLDVVVLVQLVIVAQGGTKDGNGLGLVARAFDGVDEGEMVGIVIEHAKTRRLGAAEPAAVFAGAGEFEKELLVGLAFAKEGFIGDVGAQIHIEREPVVRIPKVVLVAAVHPALVFPLLVVALITIHRGSESVNEERHKVLQYRGLLDGGRIAIGVTGVFELVFVDDQVVVIGVAPGP